MRLRSLLTAVAVTAAALMLGTCSADAATSGDSPSGFWYGTDSTAVAVSGSAAPYSMPVIGGAYGGYIGMVGDWARWQGCGNYALAWSAANSREANADLARGDGIGTGAYWFMGGPGVDPHYNGTTAEATTWGRQQAARALADLGSSTHYPVVFMDVELPGSKVFDPALDNGWNDVYTSACSGKVKTSYIRASVDRAVLNGFADYLTAHSSDKAGVYSSPAVWAGIFGTGSSSTLSNTYEWSYAGDTSSLSHHPAGWCLRGTSTCARFFGGITSSSKYAVMWQWSGGGGTANGVGDFDQIDANRAK
jgi:hypothetical protein